jgi:hypothetical protein
MLALALRVSANPCSLFLALAEVGRLLGDGDCFQRDILAEPDEFLLLLAGLCGFSVGIAVGSCSGLVGS